jgi:acetyltransferase-like isoleucine patch superfamily enzyme
MNTTSRQPDAHRWNDPIPWEFWLLGSRAFHKVKSILLAGVFSAPGLYLGRGCVIRGSRYISLGRNVYAHSNLWLEAVVQYCDQRFAPSIEIGDEVCFSDGVHVSCIEKIILKKGILMGSRVYISDHNHGVYKGPSQSHPDQPPAHRQLGGGGPVTIGENVWIGDNVIIIGPLVIGDGAVIASNSVVKGDVAPRTIVAGAPAKPIKRFNEATGAWNRI